MTPHLLKINPFSLLPWRQKLARNRSDRSAMWIPHYAGHCPQPYLELPFRNTTLMSTLFHFNSCPAEPHLCHVLTQLRPVPAPPGARGGLARRSRGFPSDVTMPSFNATCVAACVLVEPCWSAQAQHLMGITPAKTASSLHSIRFDLFDLFAKNGNNGRMVWLSLNDPTPSFFE